MNELVSVIMTVYNEEEKWLHESIQSILRQSHQYLEYIIVLDNPGNGHIKEILKSYLKKDKRIKLLINEKNIGLVKSLNKGLQYCTGKYIARMDADDISSKERIKKQLKYMIENDVDFVMSYIYKINEDGEIIEDDKNNKIYDYAKMKKQLKFRNISTHPTWFLKKDVYEKLQGYRDIQFCEDYDFILRAIQYGFKVEKMNENLLYYRVRSNSISQKNVLEQYFNSRALRKCYIKKKSLQFTNKDYLESYFRNLSPQEIDRFNQDYLYFKNKKWLHWIRPVIKDKVFREYFFDNTITIIKMKISNFGGIV
ncbi:glycosyltransferase [[Clostridium] spiroforme]|nr:glycosyltransferase [Thomasclavelia spiroformis]